MTPLTQVMLDRMGCASPGCDHDHSVLYFVQRCHPGASVGAFYTKETGVLSIECAECEKIVAELAIAKGEVQ